MPASSLIHWLLRRKANISKLHNNLQLPIFHSQIQWPFPTFEAVRCPRIFFGHSFLWKLKNVRLWLGYDPTFLIGIIGRIETSPVTFRARVLRFWCSSFLVAVPNQLDTGRWPEIMLQGAQGGVPERYSFGYDL